MKQSEVFALLKKFVGQSNILTAPVAFVRYTGSLDCAVFLSQVIYWTDRSEDGWFYKSYTDWEQEICLSEYEIRKASRALKEKGILATKLKKVNGAPVVHYRLIETVFSESILKFLQNPFGKNPVSNVKLVQDAIETNSANLDTEKTPESINKDYQRLHSKNTNNAELPPFVSERFAGVLLAFEQHRKEKRTARTPTARRSLYKRLSGWGEDRAIAALEYSMAQGWTGVFEENGNGANQKRSESSPERNARNLRENAQYIRGLQNGGSETDREDPIGLLASGI